MLCRPKPSRWNAGVMLTSSGLLFTSNTQNSQFRHLTTFKPKFHLAQHDTTRHQANAFCRRKFVAPKTSCHVEGVETQCRMCQRLSSSNSLTPTLHVFTFFIFRACTLNTKLVQTITNRFFIRHVGTSDKLRRRHDMIGQFMLSPVEIGH